MRRWTCALGLVACSSTSFDLEPPLPVLDHDYQPVAPSSPSTSRDSVPLYGGTMAVSASIVVTAQPDLDRIVGWDRRFDAVRWSTELESGSEPFRVALARWRDVALVTLRGSGEVVAVDLTRGEVVARNHVCPEPRGIEVSDDDVLVACASGELVWMGHDLEPTQALRGIPDLRDVVVSEGEIWVSRFRRADVGRVDPVLGTVAWFRPEPVPQTSWRTGEPHGAWRMRAMPEGGVLFVHQAASDAVVGEAFNGDSVSPVAYYGGPDPCDEHLVVTSHVSMVSPSGEVRTSGRLGGVVLPVDVDTDGESIAIASGGASLGLVQVAALRDVRPMGCHTLGVGWFDWERTGAVATSAALDGPDLGVVAQTTAPERLYLEGEVVELPDGPRRNTRDGGLGFGLFHSDVGAQVACASCHLEGQDDGHAWDFGGMGLRRTQNLAGGVSQRAPFHWRGDFDTAAALLAQVMSVRMQGPTLSAPASEDLLQWLDGIRLTETTPADLGEVERGAAVFSDPRVGCATCHSGADLSDHQLHPVGVGVLPTKTPSLRGIGVRAPYMSDGCAESLEARFTSEACGGGERHGQTSHLSERDLRALVAFVRSR